MITQKDCETLEEFMELMYRFKMDKSNSIDKSIKILKGVDDIIKELEEQQNK